MSCFTQLLCPMDREVGLAMATLPDAPAGSGAEGQIRYAAHALAPPRSIRTERTSTGVHLCLSI